MRADSPSSEIASLQLEVAALRRANEALEQQLTVASAHTDTLLAELTARRDEYQALYTAQQWQSRFFQRVMDNVPSLILVLGADGRIRQTNRRCSETLGISPEALKGRVLDDWFALGEGQQIPKVPWAVHSGLFELVRRSHRYCGDHRLLPHGPDTRIFNLCGVLLHTAQGKLDGAVLLATDVTDERNNLRAYRQAEAQTRAIMDALDGSIALIDGDGNIVEVNAAWRAFAAENEGTATLQSGVGLNYLTICRQARECESPAAAQALDGVLGVLQGRIPHFHLTYPCHHTNQERWFDMHITPLGDGQAGAVIAHFNTTRLNRAILSLSESETRFRELAEHVHDAFWIADWPNYRIIYVSPAFQRIWGVPTASLVNDPEVWAASIHPQEREKVWQAFQQEAGKGESSHRFRILRPDGTTRWVENRSHPIIDDDGQTCRIVGVARDITAQVQAEQALQAHQQYLEELVELRTCELEVALAETRKLASIVEDAGESIMVTDAQGRLEWVNRGFTRLTGYTAEEALGRKPGDFLQGEATDPAARRALHTAIGAGQSAQVEILNYDRQDRAFWQALMIQPLFDADGQIERYFSIGSNIDQRKQAEASLSRFRAALDSTADSIYLIDRTTMRFIDANRSAWESLGYTREELLRLGPQDIKPEYTRRMLAAIYDAALAHPQRNWKIETVHQRRDGLTFPVEILVRPLGTDDSSALVAVARDISERQQIEASLRQTQYAVDHAASAIIWVYTRDARVFYANAQASTLSGYSNTALLAMRIPDLAPSHPDAGWHALVVQLRKRRSMVFEARLRCRDGRILPIEINAYITNLPGMEKAMAFFTDISERKAAEAALQSAEQRYRTIFELSPDGILLIDPQTTQAVQFNHTARRQLGYTAEEFAQLRIADYEINEGAGEIRDHAQRLLASGEREEFVTLQRHKDGTPRNVLVNVQRVDADGTPLLLCVFRDITERVRFETQLRDAEERMRAVVENVVNGIITIDIDGNIRSFNRAASAMFGYQDTEVVGHNVRMLMPEPTRSHDDYLRQYRDTGAARLIGETVELEGRRKDGRSFPLELSLTEFKARGERYFTGVLQDITERRRFIADLEMARDAAEAANRAKSSFLAAMSHEIRTPINGVVGMAELLQHTPLDDEQRRMLDAVSHSTLVLRNIIDDILDFSKIEAGKLVVESTSLDLMRLLEEVGETLGPLAAQNSLALILAIDPELPTHLLGDPTRLRQILFNLGSNAIKFTENLPDRQGRVSIRAQRTAANPAGLTIAVRDNGIGISPADRGRLFQPFTQAENSTTRRFGGTGLGLAISQNLAHLMGSEIDVESTPGQGSTFSFTLTIAEAASDPGGPGAPIPGELFAGASVGIVSDDSELADSLARHARHHGARVEICRTDDEPPQLRQDGPCALVVHAQGDTAELPQIVANWRTECSRHGWGLLLLKPRGQSFADLPDGHAINACPVLPSEFLHALAQILGRESPAATSRIQPPAMAPTAPPSPMATQPAGRLILVAEDNAINQDVIRRQLELLGYTCELAGNGVAALALWRQRQVALVLTDCHMPDMDGYALSAAIRAQERQSGGHVPIVALTANALKGEAERCLAVGMDDYLAKPVDLVQLQRTLQRWIPVGPAASTGPTIDPPMPPVDPPPQSPIDPQALARILGDDPVLHRTFLKKFVPQSQAIVSDIAAAYSNHDSDQVRFFAHKLKSSARAVGADRLADLCLALESAGRDGNWDEIDHLHGELVPAMTAVATYIDGLSE